ncbi:MAG: hypothetical protein P8Y37_06450, partial [Anaerolineales bacterium]
NQPILWVAHMEREGLSDNLPPDTLYALYIEANGGWPYCHAGRIVDPDFGDESSCNESLLNPRAEIESQSAPFGLTFYDGDLFPPEYQNDIFIALHGTGSGDSARGYKVIRVPRKGEPQLDVEDFATGWVSPDGTPWGAPTDIIQGPDGSLYLSDDLQGVIYRIFYAGPEGE